MMIPHTLEIPVVVGGCTIDYLPDCECEFRCDPEDDYALEAVVFGATSWRVHRVEVDRHSTDPAAVRIWAAALAEWRRPAFQDKLPHLSPSEYDEMVRELTPTRINARVG